jgi:hypothetical protein
MSRLICNNLDSAYAGASVSRQVVQTRRLWEEIRTCCAIAAARLML